MTTPSATKAQNRPLSRGQRDRAGISSAPGTVIVSWLCPAASIAARAPVEQHVVQVRVEARLDEQDGRHQAAAAADRPLVDDARP